MKPKGLLIAVVLLAVLGGLVWWSNRKQASAEKTTDTTTKILSMPADQIQDVRIKTLVGDTIDLNRGNGKWVLTQPKPLTADVDAASALVVTLSTLNAEKVVEGKATDLHAYGLDIPTLDVTITQKNGKTSQLLVGNTALDASGYYATLAGDPRIFLIANDAKLALDKKPEDLRDKRLMTFDSDKLTRVELQAKGQTLEFGKNGQNEWQIVKPRPLRADNSAITAVVDKLRDARLDPLELPEDAAKKFAGAARVALATVTDAAGSQTLEIRKDKENDYFAKSSAVEGVWKTAADAGAALDKGLDDFRNKKLFDFAFSDPNKIELKGAAYVKSGDKWTSGSKTMDSAGVQTLIDKLRDLSASKFAEKAGGEPAFEATVTSGDGKRVEKVAITKQGDQYFAKRENEPSIYVLDATTVTDLQKAASDVKEAAPEPAKKK
jgi:hypothetical protein